jgi:ubiquinone/menaquinone biosynthesis C-methylase UbiE
MFLNLLAFGGGALVGLQSTLRVAHRRQPRPFPHQLSFLLDHPLRLKYRDPVGTLGLFGISPGSTVLELGCGTGQFTVEIARRVGPEGTVHAVDMQQRMLEKARQRVAAADMLGRVRFHRCGAYKLPLADESVDAAVLSAVLGQIPNRTQALIELYRVLRPGGQVGIAEEILDPSFLPEAVIRRSMEGAGFRFGAATRSPLCSSSVYYRD